MELFKPPKGTGFELGQRIVTKVPRGGDCSAVVRFIGPTHFGTMGETWIGLEMSDPIGKNDGSIADVRYFSCEPRRGIFLRPGSLKLGIAETAAARSAPVARAKSLKSTRPRISSASSSGSRSSAARLVPRRSAKTVESGGSAVSATSQKSPPRKQLCFKESPAEFHINTAPVSQVPASSAAASAQPSMAEKMTDMTALSSGCTTDELVLGEEECCLQVVDDEGSVVPLDRLVATLELLVQERDVLQTRLQNALRRESFSRTQVDPRAPSAMYHSIDGCSRLPTDCFGTPTVDHVGTCSVGGADASGIAQDGDSTHTAEEKDASARDLQTHWSASSWLSTLGGGKCTILTAIAKELAGGGGPDEQLEALRQFGSGRGVANIDMVKLDTLLAKSLRKVRDIVREGLLELCSRGGVGQDHNAKFQQDNFSQLGFGGLDNFFGGLEAKIGSPDTKILQGMIKDHKSVDDSLRTFTTGNFGITTNSETEFAFIFAPEDGDAPDDIRWYEERVQEFQTQVANVKLDREIKTRKDVVDIIEESWQAMGQTTTTTTGVWPAESDEKLRNRKLCRRPLPLLWFSTQLAALNAFLVSVGEPPLSAVEFIGARLYTGPMFLKYNAVLRSFTGCDALVEKCRDLCGMNTYTTTLHVINSALVKMSKIQPAERVYRGLPGCSLPREFVTPNEFNVRGGVEYAFLSTTTDRSVAVGYASAGAEAGIVFEIELGMVDRGASLRWLSQYPHEAEICFGPLSGLQVVGTRVEGSLLIVELRLNVNMQSLTIEQVIGKRRKGLQDTCNNLLSELQVELGFSKHRCLEIELIKPVLLDTVKKMYDETCQKDVELFNDDCQYEFYFRAVLRIRGAANSVIKMLSQSGAGDAGNPAVLFDSMSALFLPIGADGSGDDVSVHARKWSALLHASSPSAARAFVKLSNDAATMKKWLADLDSCLTTCRLNISIGQETGMVMAKLNRIFTDAPNRHATNRIFEVLSDRKLATVLVDKVPSALKFTGVDFQIETLERKKNSLFLRYASKEAACVVIGRDGLRLAEVSKHLRANKDFVLLAVKQNGGAFKFAADTLRADREVVLAAVAHCGMALQYSALELREDREVVLAAVAQSGDSLRHAAKALRADREVVIAAVAQDDRALMHAAESLRADKEIVLAAVAQNQASSQLARPGFQKDSKKILRAALKRGMAFEHVPKAHQEDKEVVLAAVMKDWCSLQFVSEGLKADKEILCAAIQNGMPLRDIPDALRADKKIVLAAVTQDGNSLEDAAETLKADKDVVLNAVSQHAYALQFAAEALKADREVILAAVTQAGSLLKLAGEAIKADKAVVLTAVSQHGCSLEYADKALKEDRDVVLAAVQNGMPLQDITIALRADKEVLLAAVRQDAYSLEFASDALKANKDVVLAAVTQHGCSLQFAAEASKVDKDVALAAVTQDGNSLRFVAEALKADKDVVLAAVTQAGMSLSFAAGELKAHRGVVLAAVTQDGCSLKFAAEALRADKKVVLTAVSQTAHSLEHVAEALRDNSEVLSAANGRRPRRE